LIPLLERVKDLLAVSDGPGTQKKASQTNAMSTSAAKKKLAELAAKSKKGRTDVTKVKATGAKRK
jgi:hypothetical protein